MPLHYYIRYPRNFDNEYELYSVQAGSQAEKYLWDHDFERISRALAEYKTSLERHNRKVDPAFSGAAPDHIVPFDEVDELDQNGAKISMYEQCLRADEEAAAVLNAKLAEDEEINKHQYYEWRW